MDGKNKRGRPKRRWNDDQADWCNKDICTLYRLAMDRKKWTHLVKYVVDTNGHLILKFIRSSSSSSSSSSLSPWSKRERKREREREIERESERDLIDITT